MKLEEKKLTSQEVFCGNLLHVFKDKVLLPDGKEGIREYIRHPGAVCIVPLDRDNNVILEQQYRYPVARIVTEIPSGKLNTKNEDPLEAAKRELKEETGLSADTWIFMGYYVPLAAYSDERTALYIAKDLHQGCANCDDDEFINLTKRPFSELIKDITDGKIEDGNTCIAVLKASEMLKTQAKKEV